MYACESYEMKVDPGEIFKNYNHNETVKCIDSLRDNIINKEDAIKDFLKKKSSKVIDNTIKIKNIYGNVEKIKHNIEYIISNYNKLINDVKSSAGVTFKESCYTKELNESEKNIIKNVWMQKYDKYEFLFNNSFFLLNSEENNYYDFVKKKKEDLINYDCFYLNNYINNIYFDINKKVSEENYIYVVNKVYTDIFICLKILNSILKNEEIRNIYKKIFDSQSSLYYLNSFASKYKENFYEILLKLIYSSYYNLTYNNNCKINAIPKCVIVLLIFYNQKNSQFIDIIKNNLFEEILNARINLINNFIKKKKFLGEKNFLFAKLKTSFKKITYLLLNTKYILLLLIDVKKKDLLEKIKKGEAHKEALEQTREESHEDAREQTPKLKEGEDKITQSDTSTNVQIEQSELTCAKKDTILLKEQEKSDRSVNRKYSDDSTETQGKTFLEIMKNDLFILQDLFHEDKKKEIKKYKEYYNYGINSTNEIKNIMNKNSIENLKLLQKNYSECVNRIYDYMVHLLHLYYYENEYNFICNFLFKEYTSIKLLYNKMKTKILTKEKYFNKFMKDVDFFISNDYLNAIHDQIFEIFFFLFFNKFISAIPFFDTKPINKWKLIIIKLLQILFYNISSMTYEKTFEMERYIFHSFLLNSFYFYYEFYTTDLDSIYTEFCKIEKYSNKNVKSRKNFQKELSEYFLTNKNSSKDKYFHNEFKKIIKEKIHPLMFNAYKLIMYIESKEINSSVNSDFFSTNEEDTTLIDFHKEFNAFMNILKYQKGVPSNISNEHILKKCNMLLIFLKSTTRGKINGEMNFFPSTDDSGVFNNANNEQRVANIVNVSNAANIANEILNYDSSTKLYDQIQRTEDINEEYKELWFYINLTRYNNKQEFSKFLNCYCIGLKERNTLESEKAYNKEISSDKEKYLNDDYYYNYYHNEGDSCISGDIHGDDSNDGAKSEQNFCLNDLKSIYFHIVYHIFKISLKCFCLEHFDNLECYLDFLLNMLSNNDMKNIICEKMNCHLVNIFTFSNIFILYIEKVINTEMYRSIIIFIVKSVLQKRIYKIYRKFICKIKEIYLNESREETKDKKNFLDKKITELYNILLLDLCFCEQILDKNTIINKYFYESLISRYRENEIYYMQACLYFIHIYKEKYNVYSEKKINENNTKKHLFFKKLHKKDTHTQKKVETNPSSYLFKIIIDDILAELNKLDNLNSIIFQKHIRLLSQNIIRNSYLLYYLFAHSSTLNNLLLNVQKEEKQKSLEIFNFNEIHMIDNSLIEDKLFKFFF
ncbi:conserved Plasmodium protein, unknown function [Plasmodium malariae]|uniref:Uncharacterized protein n=3 Tax=Plasmodium (Plasmodium) TaxID=418103 RepID=A0A1D3SPW0_PLAMA|nr:conserved Plasmodium protein, unknown function [Plasmodium malariae]SCO93951.1 conserved Plasmodium protein, unknown function [Plasmodium malariae]